MKYTKRRLNASTAHGHCKEFAETTRDFWVYVPKQCTPGTAARLVICQVARDRRARAALLPFSTAGMNILSSKVPPGAGCRWWGAVHQAEGWGGAVVPVAPSLVAGQDGDGYLDPEGEIRVGVAPPVSPRHPSP
jgi:hypothetical protein